ncbi:MAG: asparagine synthase (glutamine-hydrolyzing) [Candidatus Sericytochromatia bacterium]|nr:asparagine synthase (glutamine-hydrolyzing) [Candidatus Tanganyikabacteria bacterium]
MCGIAGIVELEGGQVPDLRLRLQAMNDLQAHRGPDGEGTWAAGRGNAGLGHRRLAIIDLSTGAQPMTDESGAHVTFNGEIYNYLELRSELGGRFATRSDTEVILKAYRQWGDECVNHFRGMFAFALWDPRRERLLAARDRFGIKPLYYTVVGRTLYLASEIKALLPFVERIETDLDGFKDYLTFQFCLAGKTLFAGIREVPAGHLLVAEKGEVRLSRYWEVYYDLDWEHTERYFAHRLEQLLAESVDLHLRSDVPVGVYVSGGLDSSLIAALACARSPGGMRGFHGRFAAPPGYDESPYAEEVAQANDFPLSVADISADDFRTNLARIIYHLDQPVAGPGSFPQFMVSGLAARSHKVLLGGQGGDEIFGGYARYLIAYFEQCIKGAIDGTMRSGNFVVSYESIIPNLEALQGYKALLQEFWRDGLFEDLDRRYFRLINRAPALGDEIRWDTIRDYQPFETFREVFLANNVQRESYFDQMTHFDFKTLLPALLQVEDRVSMAHGLESRVPMLDHRLVELLATVPSSIKFQGGTLKKLLKDTFGKHLPARVLARKDKMGFPVPISEWFKGELRDFVYDLFSSQVALERALIDNRAVLAKIDKEPKFGRNIWGLLCLEVWQREFHDKAAQFRSAATREKTIA